MKDNTQKIEEYIDYIFLDDTVTKYFERDINDDFEYISNLQENDSNRIAFILFLEDLVTLVKERFNNDIECSECDILDKVNAIYGDYNKRRGLC